MAWNAANGAVNFDCDDCGAVQSCNVEQVRLGVATCAGNGDPSDFVVCWEYMRGIGWRSFKRIGHPWTFHCVSCGPTAEVAHREHQRMEANRERLKHKNARE